MTMTDIQLSEQQEIAAAKLTEFLAEYPNTARPFFVLEGYAGTGKSFSIETIIARQGLDAQYMTYTGKAALVLNKYHNLDATTIHSAIYKVVDISDDVLKEMYAEHEAAEGEEKDRIAEEIKKATELTFELNEDAFRESKPDLLTFDIPIVALGDPGQLPPVKGTGALFTGPADATLTEILRQAKESPIIEWSFFARNKRPHQKGVPWQSYPLLQSRMLYPGHSQLRSPTSIAKHLPNHTTYPRF